MMISLRVAGKRIFQKCSPLDCKMMHISMVTFNLHGNLYDYKFVVVPWISPSFSSLAIVVNAYLTKVPCTKAVPQILIALQCTLSGNACMEVIAYKRLLQLYK